MPTNWTSLREYYGLARPYNFRVAIPLIASALLLLMVAVASAIMFSRDSLSVGTERFVFFTYIGVLLSTAAAFSRVTLLSTGILIWCATELSLALLSNTLERHGTVGSLLPSNMFREAPVQQYSYHVLLGVVPTTNWHGEWHLDRRNKDEYNRIFDNVLNNIFFEDKLYTHNSLGLRGKELSADDLSKDLIFIYGGSSTYDVNVTQGSTWAEALETELHNKFTIVNFGVPSHTTTQHLIYTAFYQNVLNKKPICALYYVGYNEIFNFNITNLDPAYANHSALLSIVRKSMPSAASYSPALRLAYITTWRRLDTVPLASGTRQRSATNRDIRLEQFFIEHVKTIAAINGSRGIKTIFIGQILNKEILNRNPNSKLLVWPESIRGRDVWPTMEHFNDILKATSISVGANYIDAGVENFNNDDFADEVHFSAAGSSKFARAISKGVESYCQ